MEKLNDYENSGVDLSVLLKLSEYGHKDGEPQIMNDLLRIFFDTTPKRLEKLSLGAERVDLQSIRLIAHSLKSSCGYLGARRMQTMCLKLEEMARLGRIAEVGFLVEAIKAEYGCVKHALEMAAANINLSGN
jgi:HPt (histidine-containing phosphotransfer) domain-containing protein